MADRKSTDRQSGEAAEAKSSGEFGRIDRFFRPLAKAVEGALDLRDDAAILAPGADFIGQLVIAVDTMVEGVHFLSEDPPDAVARKLLRVNLSDLAAMAATPRYYLLSTALPRSGDLGWLDGFAQGLAMDQERYAVALVGGDSVSTSGPIVVTITALGDMENRRAVTRGGANVGDVIFVTGTIGDAAVALRLREQGGALDPAIAHGLETRRLLPDPRTAVVDALARYASSAIDVSDGLVADLGHIAQTSAVGAVVRASCVPRSDAVECAVKSHPDLTLTALAGGDDYEIVATVPGADADAFRHACEDAGTAVTAIGEIVREPAGDVRMVDDAGAEISLATRGWTHF